MRHDLGILCRRPTTLGFCCGSTMLPGSASCKANSADPYVRRDGSTYLSGHLCLKVQGSAPASPTFAEASARHLTEQESRCQLESP